MSALSLNRHVSTKPLDPPQGGMVMNFDVGVDVIYQGALVTLNSSGDLIPAGAAGAGNLVIGVALRKADNSGGSAGGITVPVLVGGIIEHVVGSTSKSNIDDPVFATDDQTLSLTLGTNAFAGHIVEFVSGDNCVVRMPQFGTRTAALTSEPSAAPTLSAAPSAAPAGGAGATAGAYDTASNRNAMITTLNDTRTRVGELETGIATLNDTRTRLGEIETALQNAGLLA